MRKNMDLFIQMHHERIFMVDSYKVYIQVVMPRIAWIKPL